MNLAKNIQIYVKTAGTCNLSCHHCFTSGINGTKAFFNPTKTANFIKAITEKYEVQETRLLYHGGEPMLAPIDDLNLFYDLTRSQIKNVSYGIQTNLVYSLNDEKLKFFDRVLQGFGMGTSWDSDIRFGSVNPKLKAQQLALWEKNVQALVSRGHEITLMVSLSKHLIENYRPAQIIQYAIDLGIKYILFERITSDGNAKKDNGSLIPKNVDLDQWLLLMYQETKENQFFKKIGNMFLEELALAVSQRLHTANRCRGCEQKLITINPDGSLAGCPNSATQEFWGHIDLEVEKFTQSPMRVKAMCKEKVRNSLCYSCDLVDICNGDCYKLAWDDHICAAPKSLMRALKVVEKKHIESLMI